MATATMITATYTGLPDYRCLKITSGNAWALCDASDTNRLGFSGQELMSHIFENDPLKRPTPPVIAQQRVRLPGGSVAVLEPASGATFTYGGIVFQAADGKVSHTGTVRVGIMVIAWTANQFVEIVTPALWGVAVDW